MTAFARKVLSELPAPTDGGTANNYVSPRSSSPTTPTRPAARSTSSVSPRLSLFGRIGWRDVGHLRRPADPAAVGRRRQRHDLRREQAGRARRDLHAAGHRRCSRSASAGRDRRPARTRRRWASRRRSTPTASPACRPTRASRAACRRSSSPATPTSAARRPTRSGSTRRSSTRRSTTRGSTGRHSLKAGYEFQHILTEVQDVNPLYGRDQYAGQFTRPAGAPPPTTSTTWPTSCSACARPTR